MESATHTPRNRRKGREHLDLPAQVAPASMSAAPIATTTTPDDFAAFDAMMVQDEPKKVDDRQAPDEYTAEAIAVLDTAPRGPKRPEGFITSPAEPERSTRQADAAKRVLDLRADDDAEAKRKAAERVRLKRQAEERAVQEAALDARQDATARDDARRDMGAAQARKSRQRAEDRERHEKPVEVFNKTGNAKKIAEAFEAAFKVLFAKLGAAFRRMREVGVTAFLVDMRPTMPRFVLEGPQEPEPFRADAWKRPDPSTVLAPSLERKSSASSAAPEPFRPKTQEDHDYAARQAWKLGESRERAKDLYGDDRTFRAVADVFEAKHVSEYNAEILEKAAPGVLMMLNGEFGPEAPAKFAAQYASLERRLTWSEHAAERLMPAMVKAAHELENRPAQEAEPYPGPTTPTGDGSPFAEQTATEAPKLTMRQKVG